MARPRATWAVLSRSCASPATRRIHHTRHSQQPKHSDQSTDPPHQRILDVESATFHPFGDPDAAAPLYAQPFSWTLDLNPHHVWAVVGPGASAFLSHVLMGRARVAPASARSWPFLAHHHPHKLLHELVAKVAFKTRLKGFGAPSAGGEFADYTARFGALQEEDQVTLHQHMQQHMSENDLNPDEGRIQDVARRLRLQDLLHRPLIGLSNGQTRRARIARALLKSPPVLLLEEPFSGLDPPSRQLIADKLLELHRRSAPHLVLTLRMQDGVPDFVTHLVHLAESPAGNGPLSVQYVGPKAQWSGPTQTVSPAAAAGQRRTDRPRPEQPQDLVRMDNVNVSIRTLPILTSITWSIKQSERWMLKGPNGSGKSTLLSLLTGDHPQSYVQPLQLFGRDRTDIATATIQSRMGQVSPEIFNAFPRKSTPGAMTGKDAVVSGFHNIFIYRKATPEQEDRIRQLQNYFDIPDSVLNGFFAEAGVAYQALLLFLRAVAKQPELLILDEPFSGMTEKMVARCKQYIDEELKPEQALVLVTHYPEEETPVSVESLIEIDGGKIVKLERR